MEKQTRETLQNVGVAFSFAYAMVPQLRKFVNEKTEQYIGSVGSDSDGDDSTDSTSDSSA